MKVIGDWCEWIHYFDEPRCSYLWKLYDVIQGVPIIGCLGEAVISFSEKSIAFLENLILIVLAHRAWLGWSWITLIYFLFAMPPATNSALAFRW